MCGFTRSSGPPPLLSGRDLSSRASDEPGGPLVTLGIHAAHRTRRGRARALPLLLVVALSTVGCVGSGSAEPARKAAPTSTQPVERVAAAEIHGSWRRIVKAPIAPAGGMAAAWTGHQLVVWGGGAGGGGNWQPASAGAAYDPAAGRWAVLPPAPVPGRIGASAGWTGRGGLFLGGAGGPPEGFPPRGRGRPGPPPGAG